MSRVLTVLLVSGLALLIGGSAWAFPPGEKKEGEKPRKTAEERFKELDTKEPKGKLDLDEFKAIFKSEEGKKKAEEIFKKLDKDEDKFLTLEEFKAGREGKKKKEEK